MTDQQYDLPRDSRLGLFGRYAAAVACGVIASFWIPSSLQVGLRFFFSNEPEWSPTLWGEHWVLRPIASVVAAYMASLLAGAVARRSGGFVAAVSVLPAVCVWTYVAISGWTEQLLFTGGSVYVSIGNKIAASLIVLLLLPVAYVGGEEGARFGAEHANVFDSRRWTLLGVRWFHFAWIPFLVHALLIQVAWAGYYGLDWLKVSWRAGASMTSFLPFLFVMMLWGTFMILGKGAITSYRTLAGLDEVPDWRDRLVVVLKNGIGLPLLAAVLQVGIMALHYGLARLVG